MCFGVEDSERCLLLAAIKGDLAGVVRLLNDGALPDAVVDSDGRTALHWAAYLGDARMIRALLAKGADPHRQMSNDRGWTALHVAASNGNALAVRALLAGGARTDARSAVGGTPLHALVAWWKAEEAERYLGTAAALLAAGASATAPNMAGNTPLSMAHASHIPQLERVFQDAAGAAGQPHEPQQRQEQEQTVDSSGHVPGSSQASAGGSPAGSRVLQPQATAGRPTPYPATPPSAEDPTSAANPTPTAPPLDTMPETTATTSAAHPAYSVPRTPAAAEVAGAGPADLGRDLRSAASSGDVAIVQRLLLAGGASIADQADGDGYTAVHRAAANNRPDVLRVLLAAGASPTAVTSRGDTPLLVALQARRGAAVEVLLGCDSSGAAVANKAGHTPLLAAAAWGNAGAVQALLAAGAGGTLAATNSEGCNALHIAAARGHGEVVQALLAAGANPAAATDHGDTALHLAAQQGREGVAQVLTGAGAQLDASNNALQAPLHLAAAGGHAGVVATLLLAGADPRAVDAEGASALHLLAQGWEQPRSADYVEAAEALLAAGCEPRGVSNGGDTPMSLAKAAGAAALRQLLMQGASGAVNGKIRVGGTGPGGSKPVIVNKINFGLER